MIATLQSLRFVFAVMIFLHHFSVDGEGLFQPGGSCGVSFFMILSGFVMSVGYGEKTLQAGFDKKEFFIKRLVRLYPLHFLCLLGFIVLRLGNLSDLQVATLLPNAFLLQSWIPVKDFYFSGNAVSWCLSDMMFFYAMFPLLYRGMEKVKRWFLPVLVLYVIVLFSLPDDYCHPLLYISPLFRLLDFVIGMLTYKAYCFLKDRNMPERLAGWSMCRKTLMECGMILLLSVFICLVLGLELRYYCASLWWLIMPEFILLFALFNKSGGVISAVLKNKWMLSLGKISFSLYMIHQLGITIFHALLGKLGIKLAWQVELPICFFVVLCSSYLVFYYYENPISNYLKGKLLRNEK